MIFHCFLASCLLHIFHPADGQPFMEMLASATTEVATDGPPLQWLLPKVVPEGPEADLFNVPLRASATTSFVMSGSGRGWTGVVTPAPIISHCLVVGSFGFLTRLRVLLTTVGAEAAKARPPSGTIARMWGEGKEVHRVHSSSNGGGQALWSCVVHVQRLHGRAWIYLVIKLINHNGCDTEPQTEPSWGIHVVCALVLDMHLAVSSSFMLS